MPPKKNEVAEVEIDADEPKKETTTTADKIKNLTVELYETKKEKKESNKTYNEEIKRLEAEIKDILTNAGDIEK